MKPYRTLSWQTQAPVAGQGVVIVPSPVQRVRVRSMVIPFVTDAVVGNRAPFVAILDPTGIVVYEWGNGTLQAASATQDYVISPQFASTTFGRGPVNSACGLPIPDVWLPPNWQIEIGAKQIDPADQFGVCSWFAEFADDLWDQESDDAVRQAILAGLLAT